MFPARASQACRPCSGDTSGGGGLERAHLFQKEQCPPAAQEARPRHLRLTVMLIGVSFPLDSLLAGIPQKVKFTVTTGHYTVKNGDSLQLSNVEAMLILCHADNKAVIYSNTRGEAAASRPGWTRPCRTATASGAISPAVLGRH